ncbi:MAG TPA: hypothetical protein VIV60_10290 [Polyangiaceae bacterium]
MGLRVVSFRFLQAVTNAITNDQVTVGLVQWDGAQLRFAGDSRKVTSDRGRPTIRRALAAIRSELPRRSARDMQQFDDIRDAFPVLEGEGSLLRWGEVRQSTASDPERHFRDMVHLAELSDESNSPHVGRREISIALASLGEDLRAQHGDRVRINTNVRSHFEYNSPLSWQNHTWHHTMVVNADVRSSSELRDSICEIIGLLNAAIPTNEGVVLTYVPSHANEIAASVERELEYLCANEGERLRLAPLHLKDDGLSVNVVERMLVGDVRRSIKSG